MITAPPKDFVSLRDRKWKESITKVNPQGRAVLVAGTVTVTDSRVTSTCNIQCTIQIPGGTVGSPYIYSRTSEASFVIASTSGTDTSTVGWEISEPHV